MRRYALSLLASLGAGACAQIAGFDDLTARNPDGAGGGDTAGMSAAGSEVSGAGKPPSAGSTGNGGAPGASGKTSSEPSAGESPAEGGSTSAGNGGGVHTSGSGGGPSTAGAGSGGSPVIGACNVNLLRNGDFDAGATEWEQDSEAPGILDVSDLIIADDNAVLAAAKVAPKTGRYLGWLGGVLDEEEGTHTRLQQAVHIPAKVSKLVVSGWLHIKTTEPDAALSFDHFELGLLDDGDGQWLMRTWWLHAAEGNAAPMLDTWFSFSEELPESAWLDQIRGQTLTFIVDAQADTSEVTSFWVDSLSLIATCPR